jgi:hypothetical protein
MPTSGVFTLARDLQACRVSADHFAESGGTKNEIADCGLQIADRDPRLRGEAESTLPRAVFVAPLFRREPVS